MSWKAASDQLRLKKKKKNLFLSLATLALTAPISGNDLSD